MSIDIETTSGIHIGGRAMLLGDTNDREVAWAEKWVRQDPDLKWILGNYVQADNANSNGHIFPLDDLKANQETISNKPLNMLHEPHYIVGHYAAIEMLYPTEGAAKAPAASHRTCKGCGAHMAKDASKCQSCGKGWEAAGEEPRPHVEALSAFYRYYFPEEFDKVQKAHREGSLFYSMEAVPKTLTCAADGCGKEFAYKGRLHESYCAHLHEPVALRRLNQPHFKGGALIIPPVSPGWKGADITELSSLIEKHAEDAERLYEGFKAESPHLSAGEWEAAMTILMKLAHEEDKDFSEGKRKKLANQGKAKSDGSFPIENVADLKNAIKAVGRAKDPAAAKAHIKRRAKALGATDLIPDGW